MCNGAGFRTAISIDVARLVIVAIPGFFQRLAGGIGAHHRTVAVGKVGGRRRDRIQLRAVDGIGAGGAHFACRDVFQLPLVACCAKGNDVARQRLAAARPVIGDAIDGCGFLLRSRFQGFGAAADGNSVVECRLRAGTDGDTVGFGRPRFGTERNAQIRRLRLHAHRHRRLFGDGFGIYAGLHGVAGQGVIGLPDRAIDLIATIRIGIGGLLVAGAVQIIATDGN